MKPSVFEKIQALWPSEVHVFAFRWNAQLINFISSRPQPQAMRIYGFAINWRVLAGYVLLGVAVGLHPSVARLMRCFHQNPLQSKYREIWDPLKVSAFIETLGENLHFSLTVLASKLITLIAYATQKSFISLDLK